jgi:hypothetical protein
MKSESLTDFRVGERVPGTDWVMRGVVGQGGMGIVLEVRKGRNLRAAMKVLRPAFARSAEFEARFAEEVEVMARLRHPNIVEVWDCGVLADGAPFLLMELLTGRTIRAVARDKQMRFTADAVWKIVGQVCAGLGYAHNDKPPVVHRDVKPENVFLHGRRNSESKVKLLDFGIARVLDTTGTSDEVAGTPRYIAPEVLRNEPLSPKVDLYALAVLTYELLTQGFPWQVDVRSAHAVSEAHLKREPTPPSHWKSWIPNSVDECLLRALSKNPGDRQESVAEFYEQLSELHVVDDGSAKYRTDATTVPTVATMARGRADQSDSSLEIEKQTPRAGGGWLHAARARLADAGVPFEASSETAEQGAEAQPRRREKAEIETPEGESPVLAQSSTPREEAPADTPMTGASARRMDTRSRAVPAAVLVGVGLVAMAGTWGGAKAVRSARARLQTSQVLEPSAVKAAVPLVTDERAPGEARLTASVQASATASTSEPLIRLNVPMLGQEGASQVRRSPAPLHRKAAQPAQPSPNLDDILFGAAEATNSRPSAARADPTRAAGASGAGAAPPLGLDDVVLGTGDPNAKRQVAPAGTSADPTGARTGDPPPRTR